MARRRASSTRGPRSSRSQRWLDAFADDGRRPGALANRERDPDAPLPWDAHLGRRLDRATCCASASARCAATTTPDCSFGGCTGCDVCRDLGVDIVLAGGAPWLSGEFRLRVRYGKTGRLRFLSHLEVMRALRALRPPRGTARMLSRRGSART